MESIDYHLLEDVIVEFGMALKGQDLVPDFPNLILSALRVPEIDGTLR